MPRPVLRHAATLLPLAAAAALALAGCDNPACVFGGGCGDGSGGGGPSLGTQPASLPVDGDWVEPGRPTIQRAHPSGANADAKTPIVLVFSETLAEDPGPGAFELRKSGAMMQETLSSSGLLGDGRVLALFPGAELDAGETYELSLSMNALIVDLNGQELQVPSDPLLASFTVRATPAATPGLLTTYPLDAASFQSETTTMVVAFTRPIDAGTVTDDSFLVTVMGASPAADPPPQPLVVSDPFPVTETRVWTWRSIDAASLPVALGRDVAVQLSLSPAGNTIRDLDGGILPATLRSFRTAPFGVLDAAILSTPSDAINVANVTDGGGDPNPLALRIDVADVMDGDRLDLFLFGNEPTPPPMQLPRLISLRREAPIATTAASLQLDLGQPALDLLTSLAPLAGRFGDGTLAIALRLRRGASAGPVRLLDVDPAAFGIQDPVIDLHPPVLLGIGASGTVLGSGRSDLPDVAVVGRASERVRAVFVDSAAGANGADPLDPPPAVGSSQSGLFVSAPVRFAATNGVVPPTSLPLALDVTIHDRALNPAALSTTVAWTQLGASGPDDPALPNDVVVEVFDATTLAAIGGARVFVHVDDGVTPFLRDQDTTVLPSGTATLDRSSIPGEEVVVTVDAAGYDLFSFQGVPTSRLSVPLVPSGLADAQARGSVTTTDNELATVTRRVSDARRGERLPALGNVSACTFQGATERYECPFGPLAVAARRLGAESALAVAIPGSEPQYSAASFLLGFGLALPVAPVEGGASGQTTIALGQRLSAADVPFEERPLDLPAHTMATAAYPSPPDPPAISVEALSPGVPGALAVGLGVSFANGADAWRVRAAWPGAVDIVSGPGDALGSLIADGVFEPDLFLRAEVVDVAGNRGVARPRLLARLTGPSPPTTLDAPPPPSLIAPPAGGTTPGPEYVLTFADVLQDLSGAPRGLYRVELVSNVTGRRWTLWRPDPSDAAATDGRVFVPDLGPLGGASLPAGGIRCRISAYQWAGFDPALFLWRQVEREPTAAAHAAEATFTRL